LIKSAARATVTVGVAPGNRARPEVRITESMIGQYNSPLIPSLLSSKFLASHRAVLELSLLTASDSEISPSYCWDPSHTLDVIVSVFHGM
jgi:hypothetical protein